MNLIIEKTSKENAKAIYCLTGIIIKTKLNANEAFYMCFYTLRRPGLQIVVTSKLLKKAIKLVLEGHLTSDSSL